MTLSLAILPRWPLLGPFEFPEFSRPPPIKAASADRVSCRRDGGIAEGSTDRDGL